MADYTLLLAELVDAVKKLEQCNCNRGNMTDYTNILTDLVNAVQQIQSANYTSLLADLVNAVQQINTNYDGQQLLTALAGVDGDGSGLDADMLDGKHASEFAQFNEDGELVLTEHMVSLGYVEAESLVLSDDITSDTGEISNLRTVTGLTIPTVAPAEPQPGSIYYNEGNLNVFGDDGCWYSFTSDFTFGCQGES